MAWTASNFILIAGSPPCYFSSNWWWYSASIQTGSSAYWWIRSMLLQCYDTFRSFSVLLPPVHMLSSFCYDIWFIMPICWPKTFLGLMGTKQLPFLGYHHFWCYLVIWDLKICDFLLTLLYWILWHCRWWATRVQWWKDWQMGQAWPVKTCKCDRRVDHWDSAWNFQA